MGPLTLTRAQISQILEISLAHGEATPAPGEALLGKHRGGRDTLLRWLETQLGLQRLPAPQDLRVATYAKMLAKAGGTAYAESFRTDAWSTAKALLQLRDQLRLCGWDGAAHPKLPPLVRDLAKVEAHNHGLSPCEAERLAAVMQALAAGQKLPAHALQFREKLADWPKAWQPILAKLNAVPAAPAEHHAAAKAGTVLHDFQARFIGKETHNETPDHSLVWWRALSLFTAADAVAACLAELGAEAAKVAVLCEDPAAALLLDDALVRRGVPPMGVSCSTEAHPVLQLLPLWLSLSWEPIDPAQLLDLLNLPVSPIPAFAGRMLAEAVSRQPGIGGREWNNALAKLAAVKHEGAEKTQERLKALRDGGLIQKGKPLPQKLIAQRCAFIAQWAAGYAAFLNEKDEQPALAEALRVLSAHAAAVPVLAEAFPGAITEPQLQRLLASVQGGGVCLNRRPAALGGPRWLTSLAELAEPCGTRLRPGSAASEVSREAVCERLIWFGLHTADLPASPWTAHELACLQAAGIDVDLDRREHLLRREAERGGILRVSGKLLAVELATFAEERLHPVWLHGAAALGKRKPVVLEDVLAQGGKDAAWPLPTVKRKPQLPAAPELFWNIPAKYLKDREQTSAGELETRLGCPLKWVLHYVAKLSPTAVAQLPADFLLRGSFSHDILEEVFGKKPASREEAAKRAAAVFDQWLPTEAATLARPNAMQARLEVRNALIRSARAFFDLLARGDYEVVGFEFTPEVKLFGKKFIGRLDCLLKDGKGRKAVIDLKYAGKKYRDILEEGKAIQLCVYAAAAAAKPGAAPLAAGYFIIDRAQLWTLEKSAIAGAEGGELVAGPAIVDTWKAFEAAITAADGWLTSGKVPVRPFHDPKTWPQDAGLALRKITDHRFTDAPYTVCEYCDFGRLCGLRGVS